MIPTLLGRLMGLVGLLAAALFAALLVWAPDVAGLRFLGGSAALGISAWVYLDWEALSGFVASRGGREQLGSWLLIALVAGTAGLLQWAAEKEPARWDLTEDQRHSLDPQTIGILAGVPDGVTIAASGWFTSLGDARSETMRGKFEALADAAKAAGSKVQFALVDPNAEPLRAAAEEITQNGTVLLRATRDGVHPRTERLFDPEEEEIANAVARLSRERAGVIYFLTGHGERKVTEPGEQGLAALSEALRELGFAVAELPLMTLETVPEDAVVVVAAAPRVALTATEVERLVAWVDGGGSLLFAAEPSYPGQESAPSGLEPAFARWGLTLRDDMILDELMRQAVGDATAPLAQDLPYHDITKNLRVPVLFATARSIDIGSPDPEAVTAFPLARTSENAWGETTLSPDVPAQPDGTDARGPLVLAAIAELHPDGGAEGRVLLTGDVDFLADDLLGSFGNRDFALKAVGFLAKEKDVVELPARERAAETLDIGFLPQLLLMLWALMLTPGLCLGAGAVVWVWRRGL